MVFTGGGLNEQSTGGYIKNEKDKKGSREYNRIEKRFNELSAT